MINVERVRIMTKMAAYEHRDGKSCKPMTEYFRRDYIAKEILISIVTGTIAFGLLIGITLFSGLEDFLNSLNSMDIKQAVILLAIRYGIFMGIYLVVTYVIYNMRYTRGRKEVKRYYSRLSKVEKLYAEEEQQKRPTGGAV